MTVITDVPQSGIYFQQGAIVQIIAQILDATTDMPVQLQSATGLTISVLYPDRKLMKTFPATLYTDGSDGRIVYTTVNDGTTIDLSEVGLYNFQGGAVIGGVALPPTYFNDFYVLQNAFGGVVMPIVTPTAVILFDLDNVRWVGTVTPSGGPLQWVAQTEGPDNYLQFNSLVMQDDTGAYRTFTISTLGVVSSVISGAFPNALTSFILADENNKSWIVKASEAGTLVPS